MYQKRSDPVRNRRRRRDAGTALLCMSLLFTGATAQEIVRVPIGDEPEGTPGLGGLLRVGDQNYLGEPSRTDLIPLYLYEGRYAFAHGTSFGVHAFRNDLFSSCRIRLAQGVIVQRLRRMGKR